MSGFALVHTRALLGLQAPPVAVEVHLANGLPSFTLVGLADTEVKEARERVRSALQNSGLTFPSNKRITVNLAPADLPKDSGRFDLAIALGILAASDQIDSAKVQTYAYAGELSLSGQLRPVRGALAMAVAHANAANATLPLVLPLVSAREAALQHYVPVFAAEHLLDVVAQLRHGAVAADEGSTASATASLPCWQPLQVPAQDIAARYDDMADVKGQAGARRALEIAAAGGHSVLMVGTPGSGKSMLAQRFAGLLPTMTAQEALECASLHSLLGKFDARHWGQRPTRSPHHSASAVALVGGGSPPKPGEISLAHGGVLFLDELPEFPRSALESLREPLETGIIRIARAAHQAEFPAQFQLIAAMNPCPCGYLGSPQHTCRCRPEQVQRYQGRISGPLLDRIDIVVEVPAIKPSDLIAAPAGESSALVRQRVQTARSLAYARQGMANAALQGQMLERYTSLDPSGTAFLQAAAQRLGWSARAMHRVLRVARSIADLAQQQPIAIPHLAEAMQYRRSMAMT